MERVLHDLRYGARMLARSPGFTALAVLALALGIGANSAIFSVVQGVLLQPLPYHEPEGLVMIHNNFRKLDVSRIYSSPPEYLDYRAHNRVFQGVEAFAPGQANLTGDGEPERLNVGNVTAGLFPLLGVNPIHGRVFTDSEAVAGKDQVVILGHGLWQRRFGGDPAIVGRSIGLAGHSYTIVGIMPEGFEFPGETELWSPLVLDLTQTGPEARAGRFLGVIGRLKPGVGADAAQADMRRIVDGWKGEYPKNYPASFGFETSVDRLEDVVVGDVRAPLLVLLGAVGFVLLIACANVANLLLARGVTRRRELAIRAAIGARRGRIVLQLLAESVLLALAGGLLGLLLAVWGVDIVAALNPASLPRMEEIAIDSRVLLFTLGVTFIASLLFGIVPALQASRVAPNDALRAGNGGTPRRKFLRGGLVTAEVALALVLLVGAGLMLQSFARLRAVPPGFAPENVVTMGISLPGARYADEARATALYDDLLAHIRALPGVRSAGLISFLPIKGEGIDRSYVIEGMEAQNKVEVPVSEWRASSPDYFGAMGVPLVAGRDFTAADRTESPGVVIINQTLARRYWPKGDAVGKRIKFFPPAGDPWRTIIGVAGDVRHFGLDADVKPEIYSPYAQTGFDVMNLVVRTTLDPAQCVAAIRREAAGIEPDLALADIATMDDLLDRSVAPRALNTILFGIFAVVALALASVGIYGVVAFAVTQRTREIGIRMALGAAGSDVRRMVLRQGMIPVLAGVLIGAVGAVLLSRLMSSFLFGTDPGDPITYVIVAILLLAVAFLACYLPARRATRVDPMVALRYE